MQCYYTCTIAIYCSSHFAGSVSSADNRFRHLASVVFRHGPDVGLISFATFGRYRASVVFRHRPDIESISARCRRDIVDTSGRHRANVQTWSRPDISRHLPISARYNFPTSGRYRGRHFPISGRRRTAMVFRYRPTSSLYRPYVGLVSLTTSGRHRAHVQTWSRPDTSRHLLMSARYNFPTSDRYRGRHFPISGRRRTAMVFRHRPTSSLYRPDIVDDIWPTSSPESARYQPSADICRCRPDIIFRHQADIVADISRYRADIEPLWFSDIGRHRVYIDQMSA